ncbi:MAG TPA: hypothetical protein VLL50_03690 [Usitatibacter sp.]|nr:hypothetical protein [Usitatibacter sp.]
MTFAAERAVRSRSFILELPATRAFPLFEPEGERAWAKGWDPRYVHPSNGRAEAGMVFTTSHGGEDTVWLVTRHEPAAGIVEYARVTPGSRIATVLVQCARLEAARTRVTVIYTFTALSESGAAYVRAMDENRYGEMIDGWATAIEAIAR